jgi:hypothetical protein
LDEQNELGVFLGFGHLENTFGAVILVKQSLVVARHNVAFVGKRVSLQRKETQRLTLGISSQAHWKEKCYNRSSRL